ncbi:MAG: heme ABC transporter ATP-binding protein [Chitinophagaceae bacterium]|nr:MAG: heme ABC transporter ATP-binding protein [Chitinophagaceae bacterium]
MLEARDISYKVGNKELLARTNLSFEGGRFHVLMGPNGAGKTTILQLLAGELKPGTGAVLVDDVPLSGFSALERARRRAVLSQHYALQFPISVREVVALGRYPHAGSVASDEEEHLLTNCLSALDMEAFSDREYGTLSGGEAQKVQMARVLAQLGGADASDKILFLDEPVSHLDVRFQHHLLRIARQLADRGNTVIAVLHDVNLALRYADRLLLMKEGTIAHDLGDPALLTGHMLQDVLGIEARILRLDDGQPFAVFTSVK